MTEQLEVYTADGSPTGLVKPRADIHRDGDWHLASFVWIFEARARDTAAPPKGTGASRVLLQRRSFDKDVWPGRWDASCAGHVAAGETALDAAIRELDEELGLVVEKEELVRIGSHREESTHPNGLVDREHHAVFVVRCDRPLDAFRPGPEVIGLAWVDVDRWLEVVRGERATMSAETPTPEPMEIGPGELVPYEPEYVAWLAGLCRRPV